MTIIWEALGWLLGAFLFVIWAVVMYVGLLFLPKKRGR